MKPTTTKKNTEAEIRSWLPEVGEWYQITKYSTLQAFENHLWALDWYNGNKESRPDGACFALDQESWIFITNVHIISDTQPCLVDFMIKQKNKVLTLPLFPPKDLTHRKIWEVFLERKTF